MALFETYLLLGIALGIVALIRIFSAAVDGTRPRYSVLFLFVGIGLVYYARVLSGKSLNVTDVTSALSKLFNEITG